MWSKFGIMDDARATDLTKTGADQPVDGMALPTPPEQRRLPNRGPIRTRKRAARTSQSRLGPVSSTPDMRVDHPDFLRRYLHQIDANDCDILCRGFGSKIISDDRDDGFAPPAIPQFRLPQRGKDRGAECARSNVASSNLCVAQEMCSTRQPFDPEFKGWGWVKIANGRARAQSHRLRHIDNPAVHPWTSRVRKPSCLVSPRPGCEFIARFVQAIRA